MRQERPLDSEAVSGSDQRVPVIDFLRGRSRSDARSPLLDLHQASVVFATLTALESICSLSFLARQSHPQCTASRISKVRLGRTDRNRKFESELTQPKSLYFCKPARNVQIMTNFHSSAISKGMSFVKKLFNSLSSSPLTGGAFSQHRAKTF
jgi:hypothetical protein